MTWSRATLPLSPDAALVLFTIGLLLIYFELNRPGAILPGALGLTVSLISIASLLLVHLRAVGLALIFLAAAMLLLNLVRPLSTVFAVLATLALSLGFDRLVAGPGMQSIHAATASICGIVLGSGTSVLARIARRARANKAVD